MIFWCKHVEKNTSSIIKITHPLAKFKLYVWHRLGVEGVWPLAHLLVKLLHLSNQHLDRNTCGSQQETRDRRFTTETAKTT